jgi:hypothetical protein
LGAGTGLQGDYFNGMALSGAPLLTRIDPTINFRFDYDQHPVVLSPAPGIVPDDFYSVRWTGFVQPLYSETYTFYTNSDDGIRLWVNNVLLIDSWIDQNASIQRSGTIALVAGQKYDIKIEFYEKASASETRLYWSSPSTAKAIVPTSQLYPPGAAALVVNAATQTVTTLSLEKVISSVPSITSTISPNPVTPGQSARVQINSDKPGTVAINIVSSDGFIISTQKVNLVAGTNTTTVNTSLLGQGFYVISITGGDKPVNIKLLVE